MALIKLGKDSITSLTDNTDEASKCNLLFDEIRQQVLMEGVWAFATKRQELGQLTGAPTFEYDYHYQLPTDCLYVISINDVQVGDSEYVIENRKLKINDTSVKIKYVADEEDVSKWSPGFKESFILRMAAEMSYAFRADKALTQLLFQQYREALDRSLAIDGKQGSNERVISPELLDVR